MDRSSVVGGPGGTWRRVAMRRFGWRVGGLVAAANLAAALFVFLYAEFLLPTEQPVHGHGRTTDVVMFVVYMAVSAVVGWRRSDNAICRALAWVEEERSPTPLERADTLRLAWRLAVDPLICWVVAALLFGVGNVAFGHTATHAAKITITVLLGGVVTTMVGFLLIERAFRPVFAVALAGDPPNRPVTLGVRPRLMLTWALGSGVPLVALALLPPASAGATYHRHIGGAVVALSIVGLVVGVLTTYVAARSVTDPLDDVRREQARVEAGDLEATVEVDDGGEIGMLQAGFNRMVSGLRERERLHDLFGRHVGTEVAALALEQGTGLGGEQREATALFVDIIGSTPMAEVLPPGEVVAVLNAFFGAVVRSVTHEGGWVNKFEGDGALCVFGAPAVQPDHAARALRAARAIDAEVRSLAGRYPGLAAAIGVSSGSVVAGNVGTEQRYEYTVIGRPVNEAARLSDVAKTSPGRVLAGGPALERAGDEAAAWASLGTVALRGQSHPVAVFAPVTVMRTA